MSGPRDEILGRIRAKQPAASPLPPVPLFDAGQPATLEAFRASLERMGGRFVEGGAAPEVQVRELFPDAKVIVSATPEVQGTRPIAQVRTPAGLDDVDVGVVRARFGVAETGSVWLSEAELGINALGFLSQHLVVLLDPREIVANLHHAYRDAGFREARYAVLMTGPSATADIEGILIHGAQGIRSLTLIAWPRPVAGASPRP
jgi:L-lactate dehydrogenase complex protein LldG